MSNHSAWVTRRIRTGWVLLLLGLAVGLAGAGLELAQADLNFNTRLVTGLGILLLGLGIAELVKARSLAKDSPEARRSRNAERDERMQAMRAKAGNRAYWVSALLGYALLMWVSLASNGSLPAPSEDGLWFYLAGLAVIPFVIYIASIVYDQNNN